MVNLGLHSSRRGSKASEPRSSVDGHPDNVTGDDEMTVDEEQGSILSHIISQLRPGADLSRVTLPTFFLEPRSMLERITNFMAHPEIMLPMPDIDDPTQRFVSVVKFYLSGWHIKPPGVKKPLNPILGEVFYGYWDYQDGTRGYYISEQTSHHPPKSSYFYMCPEHHIRIDGTLKPRGKFLGNSAASMMEGLAIMRFTNRNERYFVTQPNMYARGVLFGKMKYELGDHSLVKCPESGLEADIEFKTKGWVGGHYDEIGGFIKDSKTQKKLFELSGFWNGEMSMKDLHSGKKTVLFDATHARETPVSARPIQEQEDHESQRLWQKTIVALKRRDQNAATDEKTKIEDMQREEAARRGGEESWQPRLFRRVRDGPGEPEDGEGGLDWIINADITGRTAQEQTSQILSFAPIVPASQMQGQVKQASSHTQQSAPTPQQHSASSLAPSRTSALASSSSRASSTSSAFRQAAHTTAPSQRADLHDVAAPRVQRQDSITDEVDEFVDAN